MNKRLILFVVLIITPLSGLVIDLYAPSMPALTQAFHTTASAIKLTITIAMIGFACGQFVFGGLSDIFGRKKPLQAGILLFCLSSLVPIFSHSLGLFYCMRFIQGASAASTTVSIKAINSDVYSGDELVKVTIYSACIWAGSPIFAPVLGSYLQHYFGWQANFITYSIAGAIMLACVCLMPETSQLRHPFHPIKLLKKYCLVFSHKSFMSGVLSIAIGYTSIVLFSLVGPFLIIRDLGYSVLTYGHIAFALGCMTLCGSILTKFLLKWTSSAAIAKWAIIIILMAMVIMFGGSLHYKLNIWIFLIPMFIAFLFESMYYPTYLSSCMSQFAENRGIASACIGITIATFTFLITLLVSFIPTKTLLPIASIYLILSCVVFILYFAIFRYVLSGKN